MGCRNSNSRDEFIVSFNIKNGIFHKKTEDGIKTNVFEEIFKSLNDMSKININNDSVNYHGDCSELSIVKEI